jgi:uncharacterized protein (DUF1800 family)
MFRIIVLPGIIHAIGKQGICLVFYLTGIRITGLNPLAGRAVYPCTDALPMQPISANLLLQYRAGFGPAIEDIPGLDKLSPKTIYRQWRKTATAEPAYLRVTSNAIDGLVGGIREAGAMEQLSNAQKNALRKQSVEGLRNLNLRWLDEMVYGNPLREKMAFFWHGHFACRNLNIYFQQQLLDILRRHALGNFAELLREVSRSAAMLAFLNNQQNRKQSPNENFAREVMELFTMGRGHYSETDIREAARAFTGWGFNLQGEFVFRANLHDGGTKTVLGRTGRLTGDDVLDILLQQKQTARFIAGKIYRFFVHESPDPRRIDWLADRFYASGYDIGGLMDDIFLSDWFYDPKFLGAKIKSPVELLAGLRRMLPMEFERPEVQLLYQRLLGQVLFNPPNVAGWPGGKNWIDSSSLMYRLRLPRLLHDDDDVNASPKDDDDVMMGVPGRATGSAGKTEARKGLVNVDIDWKTYVAQFQQVSKERLAETIAAVLLPVGTVNLDMLMQYVERDSREHYIRSLTIGLMSTPEYQMS